MSIVPKPAWPKDIEKMDDKQFRVIVEKLYDWWNLHNAGNMAWDNVNATNATITTLTATTITSSALKVVQIVNATGVTTTSTTGTSFTDTTVTKAITPTSASNKIFVVVSFSVSLGSGTADRFAWLTVNRGATNLGDATNGLGGISNIKASSTPPMLGFFALLDAPATTSSTTYTLRIRANTAGDTVSVPEGQAATEPWSITLFEVVA